MVRNSACIRQIHRSTGICHARIDAHVAHDHGNSSQVADKGFDSMERKEGAEEGEQVRGRGGGADLYADGVGDALAGDVGGGAVDAGGMSRVSWLRTRGEGLSARR